jgi:hypothetical protein
VARARRGKLAIAGTPSVTLRNFLQAFATDWYVISLRLLIRVRDRFARAAMALPAFS